MLQTWRGHVQHGLRVSRDMIVFVMLFLLYPSHSTGVANLRHYETLSHIDVRTNIKRASDGSRSLMKQLRFKVFLREFHLTIKPSTGLVADGFRVHLIHGDGSTSLFHFDSNRIFSGHLTDRQDVRVHAHIEDRLWSIQIYDHNDTYSIEPACRLLTPAENPINHTLIAYRASDLTSNSFNGSGFCGVRDHHNASVRMEESVASEKSSLKSDHDFPHGKSDTPDRDKRDTDRITCSLYLVGDYTFLKGRCRGNYVTCTAVMFSFLEQAKFIYEHSLFVGHEGKTFQGIHLSVGQIYLFTAYSTPITGYPHSHFNEERPWTIDQMLDAFSLYVSYMTDSKQFCAHHLFTDHPFPNRILGLAWTKSICAGYSTSKPGVAKASSGVSSGSDIVHGALPSLQMALVFAHGHSFGSEHDPNIPECNKPDTEGGNFLMWEASVSGNLPNHLKFSPCSLKWIGSFLQDNNCFKNMHLIPSFCGNGVVEEGEVCDAGIYGVIDTDYCCSSTCQLRNYATCSDKNQVCCTNCSMAPTNIECMSINHAECKAASYLCVSGVNIATSPRTFSNNDISGSSLECPEPLPLPNWTTCKSYGQCHNGRCWNFCEIQAVKEGLKLKECLCRSNVGSAACKLCCFNVTDVNNPGPCTVYSNNTLIDGTLCYLGHCEKGVCLEPSASHIRRLYRYISYIQGSSLESFMMNNIVLIVVVLSLTLWLPSMYFISRADEKALRAWNRKSFYLTKSSVISANVQAAIVLKRENSLSKKQDIIVCESEHSLIARSREISLHDVDVSITSQMKVESLSRHGTPTDSLQ